MITLKKETAEAIRIEMESIPEKYQKPFNSTHEALGVIREEYIELEQEIFFGEKQAEKIHPHEHHTTTIGKNQAKADAIKYHKSRIKKEAIQVAAMCARLIQEL